LPEPAPVSEHRLRRRVQFYETDAAGIVHFSVYFRYMEEAEHALWRAAGLSIAAPGATVGWPRVACSFEYFRPLRFEEEFEARILVAGITEKSIRYVCLLSRGGEKVAKGTLTIVPTTKPPNAPMRAVPIPPEVAGRFAVAPGADEA
jgi:YbgC/YbaW family acyl-CoA thioester hydrolase